MHTDIRHTCIHTYHQQTVQIRSRGAPLMHRCLGVETLAAQAQPGPHFKLKILLNDPVTDG